MKFSDLNLREVGHEIQMVGAIYAGAERAYLCVFPDEQLDVSAEPLEMDSAEWQLFLRQSDLLEVEVSEQSADGTIAKAIVRKSQRQIDQNVSWTVYRRDRYRCRYCARADVPLTVDHLVQWEEGGPSTVENLLASCKKCNRVRGNLAYAAWLSHAYYRRMSQQLDAETRQANEDVAATLDAVPRVAKIRSR